MQKVFSAGARARAGAGTDEETRVQCAHIQFARDLARVTLQEVEQVIHKRAAAEETAGGKILEKKPDLEDMYGGDDDERIGRSKKSGDREHGAR